MLEHDLEVGIADDARGGHVIVLLDGEDLGAHDARVFGDGHQSDGHDRLFDAGPERRHDGDGQKDGGDGQHHVHDAHDDGVPLAALVAGDGAQDDAHGERDGHGGQAHGQRDLRAHEHAAEDVAALDVGAEPVLRRGPQQRFAEVLRVRVVGQDAGRQLRDDGDGGQDQDEDAADERRLVGHDAREHVFPDALVLLLDRLAVQQRGIAGRLRGEQLVLRHADHPSSFAPYLMRGSR